MLSKFLHFWFLLFDCFVCHQTVTYPKRFARYEHYAGEVEDIITAKLATVSSMRTRNPQGPGWLGGLVVGCRTCDLVVVGSI